MYYNNIQAIILYILCTLQLQPYLLTMASKQSANTSTSMTKEQSPMPPAPNTAHGKTSVAVTSSTHNLAPTSAVHKYVTYVAELISASADTRKMFLTEVTKKCLEMAKKEKDSQQQSPMKLPQSVTYPNYSHGQILPPKETDVLDKRIDHFALPTTNTTSEYH